MKEKNSLIIITGNNFFKPPVNFQDLYITWNGFKKAIYEASKKFDCDLNAKFQTTLPCAIVYECRKNALSPSNSKIYIYILPGMPF